MKVDGREHLPASGPTLIVCNHVAFVDPLLVAIAALPLLMIEPMAFSAMLDRPPALFPGVVLAVRRIPFHVPRSEWRELLVLAFFNMLVWHALIIFAVKDLSSGRAGIIGYTMPVFSAVFGYLWFGIPTIRVIIVTTIHFEPI